MRRAVLAAAAALSLAAPWHPARAADRALRPAGTVQTDLTLAGRRIADLDGDGRDEVVLVARDGRVRVVRRGTDGALSAPLGELVLPDPARSLLALGHVGDDERTYLLVASPGGIAAYPSVPGAWFAVRPVHLSVRARFTLRVGEPRFAPIARDLNGDGRSDVLVPFADRCEIWLQRAGDESGPSLALGATVNIDVDRRTETGGDALSDVLESAFTIQDIRAEDVNGDGRRDLLVADADVRAFHLQRSDGSFPADPDVRVDLSLFRDTTPEAKVRLGRTLAGSDDQRYESRDLDGDGIPDHVIAHRRKVWVFLGTRDGPQFEHPVAVLKTAEDMSALLLVRVDEDALPDLVLVRLEVPSIATILKGLLTEWDVELSAVGYPGRAVGGFDTKARWKGELTVRLPALLGVIRDPDALIRRFESVSQRFGKSLIADFDGDGRDDVLLVNDGESDSGGDGAAPRVDVWLGAPGAGDADAERVVGHVLFDDANRTWTLERMLAWLGDLAQRRAARLTGGRKPAGSFSLRADATHRGIEAADLRGDGAHEIVVIYDGAEGGIVDVLAWR